MASLKPDDSHFEYLESYLTDVKVQLDNIKTYWEQNSWLDADANVQSKKFNFHSQLIEKYYNLLEKHNKMTGIVDYMNSINSNKKKELRKGNKKNALQERLKQRKKEE